MTKPKNRIERWLDEHPLFRKSYVPMVLTATFVVTIADAWFGGKGS